MLHSLMQHPFVAYTAILSTVLAAVLVVLLRIFPERLANKPWLFAFPLAVPVMSYIVNYVILGKICSLGHTYHGNFADLPSLHFFCVMNERYLPWVGAISLVFILISLLLYGMRHIYLRNFRQKVPLLSGGGADARFNYIIDDLSHQWGITRPETHVLDYDRSVLMTAGTFKKAVIVSRGTLHLLDDSELRAALAHEMEHIKRDDCVANWLFILLRDLMMFSPASLWAYARYRQAEELICDAQAANRTGLGLELASALVKFARHGSMNLHGIAQLLPGSSAISVRVHRLLSDKTSQRPKPGYLSLFVVLLTMVLLIFVC
jgi:Zn-dependent protease with chaperone function